MKRYYSKTTQTTYVSGIHAAMPEDAVVITDQRFDEVIGNPIEGKVRGHDAGGLPILIDPPGLTLEQLAEAERQWRDGAISQVQWLINRHRDEIEIGLATTLTTEQFPELLAYVQSLRDWPQSPDFPDSQHRPTAPDWIAEQTK
jgi:hypothetical protein